MSDLKFTTAGEYMSSPKEYLENIDYELTPAEENNYGWNVRILVGLFPKDVVSGGTGIYYSADNIWIVGRQQDKQGTEIKGYHFVINVEKSRYVKEKSKIPISVSWDGGVQQWSGLLDVAMSGNYVSKPSPGWYCRIDKSTGELVEPKVREKETLNEEFWKPIIEETDFKQYVTNKYSILNNIVNLEKLDAH